MQCDAPRNTGWRPGARWAREDVQASIEALPYHQRPPMRELGRRSEAAAHPFRAMPPDEGGALVPAPPTPTRVPAGHWRNPNGMIDHAPSPFRDLDPNGDPRAMGAIARWNAMPSIRYPGEGPHPNKLERMERRGSNDPHAKPPGVVPFFDTARTTADVVARNCPEQGAPPGPAPAPDAEPPLVTAQKVGSRVEIAAASPAALAMGLTPGMALTQARASVPDLDVRDADPAGDRAALERLALTLARRWTPTVMVADDATLLLDLTGVAHLHGGEARLGRRLCALLARHGVGARVAVADTVGAAWALAHHGPASAAVQLCASGTHAEAIAPLPVAALRLDPVARELLARLGIDRVGALAAMPRGPLVRRFGTALVRRLDQALGRLPEPLVPVPVPEPVVVAERFAEPIATPEAIAASLARLVAKLATALAGVGQGARLVELAADRVDHAVQRLRIGLARPTREPGHLLRLLARRIEEIEPGYGIDALTLHVRRADPLGPEALAPELAEESAPDLAPLVDAIANRIGAHRLWRSAAVESDVPERAVAAVPPLDPAEADAPALKADDVRRLDERAPTHPWQPRWPRPARLLRRPEQLDNVVSLWPDGAPRRFTWRGRSYAVVRADGPERIAGEWWRRPAERAGVRDYFRVEDEGGARFWLYRRGDAERAETGDRRWFLHGWFA